MIFILLSALLVAPLYWLVLPERARRDFLTVASLGALGFHDLRLPIGLLVFTVLLFLAIRALRASGSRATRVGIGAAGLLLGALFVWNKQSGTGLGTLPSQEGLALVGISYLVLKAAAVMVEAVREPAYEVQFRSLLGWLVFLPTYPSGPIEEYAHFSTQDPRLDRRRIGVGLERILFGLLKALVISSSLGQWADGILAPGATPDRWLALFAIYALTLRFYFDFSGYSDIAIGLGAVFGYDISENFDRPLLRRNLVQLWRGWHMTLTNWLRSYLFIPISRTILRRGKGRFDTLALVLAQLITMLFCGLWHGLGWNFAIWGLLQGLGLIWVGIFARRVGRRLSPALVSWWRSSRLGYAISLILTFNFFALSTVFAFAPTREALRELALLIGLSGV